MARRARRTVSLLTLALVLLSSTELRAASPGRAAAPGLFARLWHGLAELLPVLPKLDPELDPPRAEPKLP